DELQFFKYADRALAAYSSWPRTGQIELTGNTYDNYGPAFVMAVQLGAEILQPIFQWSLSDLRHFLYFLTYLIGIWAFYALAKRWLSQTPAIGATLLFATQPLFWGHAFISPKDIPFLTFFLLTLEFGFRMVDSLPDAPQPKRTLLVLTALWLASVFGLFVATPAIHAWIESLVRAAAAGQTNIISSIASDIHTARPEIYIQKYFVYFLWARSFYFLLSTSLLALLYRKHHPSAFRLLLFVLPAALLLGVTTSIRVLGPFAALFIIYYAFCKHGKKAIPALIIYSVLALFVTYLTWPYLWLDPLGHFIESVHVMSAYPWQGQVLFNGAEYPSTGLPYSYLPVLLGIQLTEPVWVLFAVGLAVTVIRSSENREFIALTLVWFILPLIYFIVTRSPLYDNFRQIFFILPPIFLTAGVVFEKIKRPVLQIALIALCVLPGIIDGIRLHPYEYIYYNRFIGGEAGASRRFELDYWGTSYREAADWLNVNAPANANIWAEGPAHLLGLYLRPDLKLYSSYEAERADHYNYVVALTRYNLDLQSYPDAPIVHTIERDGSLLTVIKQP
ncbi:MAG: hypothetical protein HY258_04115, partial [Chloroflexi bacterium]|nr:hypothetical protein [Chloroflexota bacterium]